jgi:hypothetical protein
MTGSSRHAVPCRTGGVRDHDGRRKLYKIDLLITLAILKPTLDFLTPAPGQLDWFPIVCAKAIHGVPRLSTNENY